MIRKILVVVAIMTIALFLKIHFSHRAGNLIKPVTTLRAWHWEQFGEASGGLYLEGDAIRCEILKTDGTDWHVQLYQMAAPVVEGREYRIHFMARADGNFVSKLSISTGGKDIHSIGLEKQIPLVSQWISYDYTFTANKTGGDTLRMPYFMFGTQTGKVWIKDLVVEEA